MSVNMSISQITFLVIWLLFIIALPLVFRKKGVKDGQMIATGLGILGTFMGIVIGLLHFDVNNIETAVPELLGGLKIAFFTSIAGMGFSLIIGMFSKQLGFEDESKSENKTDYDLLLNIVTELQKINKNIAGKDNELSVTTQINRLREDSNEMIKELQQVNKNIVGDSDTSLDTQVQKLKTVMGDKQDETINQLQKLNENIADDNNQLALTTQISKLREDSNNKQDELKHAFDNFAQQMAENNMEVLVQAIQQVMNDFNTQINDRLGDSFNDLNSGVNNLLEWQEKNKEQMTTTINTLNEAENAISTSTDAFKGANNAIGNIGERMEILTQNAQSFDNTATQLGEALETMGSVMVGMKELAQTLNGSGKIIKDEMQQMTEENLQNIKEITTAQLEELSGSLAGIFEKIVQDHNKLLRELEQR